MKKLLFYASMCVAALATSSFGETIFTENFDDMTIGNTLQDDADWTFVSAAAAVTIPEVPIHA